MQADFNDLDVLAGSGGEPFQSFLFDLVVEEATSLGIPVSKIRFDHRVNIGDGGRDIFIDATHSGLPLFIPCEPSVWSAKSGADGLKPAQFRHELMDDSHQPLRDHLLRGEDLITSGIQLPFVLQTGLQA
jgi:hypothetical protein